MFIYVFYDFIYFFKVSLIYFNPAVSAGLYCIYTYVFYFLVICCKGPQGRIVILTNCVTLYNKYVCDPFAVSSSRVVHSTVS